jgi:hypothetical protein
MANSPHAQDLAVVPLALFGSSGSTDLWVYVLDGTVTTTLDRQKRELRRGRACSFPGGCVHTHENLHDDPARVLIMMTSGSIGRRYYEGVAQEVNVYGKPDFAKIEEISEPRSCAGLSAHSDSFPGRVYDGLCGAAAALPLRYRKRLPLATVQHMARSKMVKVSSWHS